MKIEKQSPNKINLIVNTVETIKLIFFKLPLFKDTSRTEVTSNPQLITIENMKQLFEKK